MFSVALGTCREMLPVDSAGHSPWAVFSNFSVFSEKLANAAAVYLDIHGAAPQKLAFARTGRPNLPSVCWVIPETAHSN